MKVALIGLAVITGLILLGLFQLAYNSKNPLALGVVDEQLLACHVVSNCVNSAATDAAAIDPIRFTGDSTAIWAQLPAIVESMKGEIVQQDEHYLWFTFKSPFFGFVDDMEVLMDAEHQQLQVRSSSRVGRSDFSKNRERVEAFRHHVEALR